MLAEPVPEEPPDEPEVNDLDAAVGVPLELEKPGRHGVPSQDPKLDVRRRETALHLLIGGRVAVTPVVRATDVAVELPKDPNVAARHDSDADRRVFAERRLERRRR